MRNVFDGGYEDMTGEVGDEFQKSLNDWFECLSAQYVRTQCTCAGR